MYNLLGPIWVTYHNQRIRNFKSFVNISILCWRRKSNEDLYIFNCHEILGNQVCIMIGGVGVHLHDSKILCLKKKPCTYVCYFPVSNFAVSNSTENYLQNSKKLPSRTFRRLRNLSNLNFPYGRQYLMSISDENIWNI